MSNWQLLATSTTNSGRGYSLMLVPLLVGSVERAISHAAVDDFLTLGLELIGLTMMVLLQPRAPFVMVVNE